MTNSLQPDHDLSLRWCNANEESDLRIEHTKKLKTSHPFALISFLFECIPAKTIAFVFGYFLKNLGINNTSNDDIQEAIFKTYNELKYAWDNEELEKNEDLHWLLTDGEDE